MTRSGKYDYPPCFLLSMPAPFRAFPRLFAAFRALKISRSFDTNGHQRTPTVTNGRLRKPTEGYGRENACPTAHQRWTLDFGLWTSFPRLYEPIRTYPGNGNFMRSRFGLFLTVRSAAEARLIGWRRALNASSRKVRKVTEGYRVERRREHD
jgi:hypothetical protein